MSDSEVHVKIYQDGLDIPVFNDTLTAYADGNFDIIISDYSIVAGDGDRTSDQFEMSE